MSRPLPERANLRHLKLEAKRRLAEGEFTALNEAQLAIAREYGFSSWTALKAAVEPATAQVRWVIDRFRDATAQHWQAPPEDELREHFAPRFLALVPPETLVTTLRGQSGQLAAGLEVSESAAYRVRARVGDLRVEAVAEPEPPHRLAALRLYPLGTRLADERTAAPPAESSGPVPAGAFEIAERSFQELGLAGLVIGGSSGQAIWTVARGWADLDRDEPFLAARQFPAYGLTKVVTAAAVLCLGVRLDEPANTYLRTLRLADEGVTVRELLSHTSGVGGPETRLAEVVPDPLDLLGPVVSSTGPRGEFAPSNGGYAVLGQLLSDVTGVPYAAAVTRLVLEPLRMRDSSYPDRWPAAATGYRLGDDGRFTRVGGEVFAMPAAGGLWTTAPDLIRFGRGWSSLFADALGREAIQGGPAQPATGTEAGLGWIVSPAKGVYGHAGAGPGGAVSLLVQLSSGEVTVAATNRGVPVETISASLLHRPK
jgi:CubicO group peptidase (beta-lactamase class C family)